MKITQESEDRIVIQYESDADISPAIYVPTFTGDISINKDTTVSRDVDNKLFRLVNILRGNNAVYVVYWLEK